jgi:death on curing protein
MTDSAPWEHLITLERIMSLHAEGIKRYGGAADIKADTRRCVEGALGSAWSAELYDPAEGAEPGLGFAAYLLRYLNSRHCFVDGNKRVAWLAMVDVFRAKRLEIDATEEEAEELVKDVIVNDLPVSEITYWIADRLQWVH